MTTTARALCEITGISSVAVVGAIATASCANPFARIAVAAATLVSVVVMAASFNEVAKAHAALDEQA